MKWLKPYSSLFYVANQEDFIVYDERTKNSVATIKNGGSQLVNCNCSISMPLLLLSAFENGDISMVDFRMMNEVGNRLNTLSPITQFDVHQHLPFAVGVVGEKLMAFSYEGEELESTIQDMNYIPDSFCLHLTEASCAVRSGNNIQCVIVDY